MALGPADELYWRHEASSYNSTRSCLPRLAIVKYMGSFLVSLLAPSHRLRTLTSVQKIYCVAMRGPPMGHGPIQTPTSTYIGEGGEPSLGVVDIRDAERPCRDK